MESPRFFHTFPELEQEDVQIVNFFPVCHMERDPSGQSFNKASTSTGAENYIHSDSTEEIKKTCNIRELPNDQPVLEANDINCLFEKFEASAKAMKQKRSLAAKVPPCPKKNSNIKSGRSSILIAPRGMPKRNKRKSKTEDYVQSHGYLPKSHIITPPLSDHDYCRKYIYILDRRWQSYKEELHENVSRSTSPDKRNKFQRQKGFCDEKVNECMDYAFVTYHNAEDTKKVLCDFKVNPKVNTFDICYGDRKQIHRRSPCDLDIECSTNSSVHETLHVDQLLEDAKQNIAENELNE